MFKQPTWLICPLCLLVLFAFATFASPCSGQLNGGMSSSSGYRLGPKDTLGVIVDGILGDFQSAPIHMPSKKNKNLIPGIGYPMAVRDDGTLPLPEIAPVNVTGMSIQQAQDTISQAYIDAKILRRNNQVMVNLLRKRTIDALVIHDELPRRSRAGFVSGTQFNTAPRQRISQVTLTADQATKMHALAEAEATFDPGTSASIIQSNSQPLRNGDSVLLNSPVQQNFYTSGLLPGGQFPITEGLTVSQAIALSGGSVAGFRGGISGIGPTELTVFRNRGGRQQSYRIDNPNSSNFRIEPGDMLSLQYKRNEIIGNIGVNALRGGILRFAN